MSAAGLKAAFASMSPHVAEVPEAEISGRVLCDPDRGKLDV
jgi:hypothetical protein